MMLHHFLFTSDYQPLGLLQTEDSAFVETDIRFAFPVNESFAEELARWEARGIPTRIVVRQETGSNTTVQTREFPTHLYSPDFMHALTQWVLQHDHRLVSLPETHTKQIKELLELELSGAPLFDFLRALAQTPAEQLGTWSAGIEKAGR